MTPLHRKNNFDFIRMVAALCVLFSHQHALTGLREPSVLNVHSLGGFSVLMFFSISGFLVAQSWEADPNLWRFSVKRFLRIWPGFAVVIILAAVVLGPLVSSMSLREYYAHPLFKDYFSNLHFTLRDGLPLQFTGSAIPTAINGALWTIPLELKCYVALGFLGLIGVLGIRLMLPLLTLLAAAAYFSLEPQLGEIFKNLEWTLTTTLLIQFSLFFFAGSSFYYLRIQANKRHATLALGISWITAIIAITLGKPLLALWLVVPVTTLVFGNMSTPGIRDAGRYGDLSYGIYIYAFPVQQTFIWLWKDHISWWTLLGITAIATTTLAFLSWHLIEKTALQFKPKRKHPESSSKNLAPKPVLNSVD